MQTPTPAFARRTRACAATAGAWPAHLDACAALTPAHAPRACSPCRRLLYVFLGFTLFIISGIGCVLIFVYFTCGSAYALTSITVILNLIVLAVSSARARSATQIYGVLSPRDVFGVTTQFARTPPPPPPTPPPPPHRAQ